MAGIIGKELYDAISEEDFQEIDEIFFQNLHGLVKGDGKNFVSAHEVDRSGLDLYRDLAAWFDPTRSEDQSVEHARVTRPDTWLGKAQDPNAARIFLEEWQSERRYYEAKYATEVAQMDLTVALKSLMSCLVRKGSSVDSA